MKTANHQKITKLIHQLKTLIAHLDSLDDLVIHKDIDQFFYMTKSEELKFLFAQYEEEKKRFETTTGKLEMKYKEIFQHWQRDVRLLNTYLNTGEYAGR